MTQQTDAHPYPAYTTMTEHDIKLLEKADRLHLFRNDQVLDLIDEADTAEAREWLRNIYWNTPMTEHDIKLLERAKRFSRYDYDQVLALIDEADTPEARERLQNLYLELYWATLETL